MLKNGIEGYTHNSVSRLVPDVESLSITSELVKDATSIMSNNFKSLLSSITLTNKKLDTIATNINSLSGDKSFDWRLALILISLVAVFLGFVFTGRWNIELKTLDLMQSFQQRYDKLMLVDVNEVVDTKEAQRFLERMWNLQLEQFEYWQQGYIKDERYIYWMKLRRKKYENLNDKVFDNAKITITYISGWEYVKTKLCLGDHTIRFDDFMNDILLNPAEKIDTILDKNRKSRCRRFIRWFGIYIS